MQEVVGFAEEYYEKYLKLFHHKKTIAYAVTGLLILHLLVDIGHYVIPYVTGFKYPWYFELLGPGHQALSELLLLDMASTGSILTQIGAFIVYFVNSIALFLILASPFLIWLHTRSIKELSKYSWIYFATLTTFILLPIFRIEKIRGTKLIGADILTQQIPHIQNVWYVIFASAVVGAIFYILTRINHERTFKLATATVLMFTAYYIYIFASSVIEHTSLVIVVLLREGAYYTASMIILNLTIIIAFYTAGYIAFAYGSLKGWKNLYKTEPKSAISKNRQKRR